MTIFFTVFLCLAALFLFLQSACYLRNRQAGEGTRDQHSSHRPSSSGPAAH